MKTVDAAQEQPVALTIAGSDSGGGAGIQADLKTFQTAGVFGTSVITCLTAQNPDGVSAVQAMSAAFVREQLKQVNDFFRLGVVKTGMLFNCEIVEEVVGFVEANPLIPVVVDPVMVATSGAVLLEEDAIASIRDRLLPKARLITPNLDEAAVILGWKSESVADMEKAAGQLVEMTGTAVLLKGGHLEESNLTDWLVLANGFKRGYNQKRNPHINTHGSGCTLASSIAARLARGADLESAVTGGLEYLQAAMQRPIILNGTPWIGH